MITNTVTAIQQLSTGINVAYPFPNKIFAASDLAITAIDLAGTAHPFTFLSGSTFTGPVTASVTNIDVDTGCTVTLSAPLAANWILDIRTNTAELQQTSIKNQGQFLPDLHEEAFDRLTREVQDLKRLTYTFGMHGTDSDIVPWKPLPGALGRAFKTLGFDSTGQPIVFTEGEAGASGGLAVTDGNTLVPLVETLAFAGATVVNTAANTATVTVGTPQTATELAVGVVPAATNYGPGDLRRYGAVGGAAGLVPAIDDSAAWATAASTGLIVIPQGMAFKVLTPATTAGQITVQGYGKTSQLYCDGAILTVNNGTDSFVDNFAMYNITAPWIITRLPTNWAANMTPTLQQSNTVLGYQPTVNDADIWPSLTAAQQNQSIGPTLIFQGNASNIEVSRIYGRFVSVLIYDAVNSSVHDCDFRGGKSMGGIVFWNINLQIGDFNRAYNNRVLYASNAGVVMARNYDFVMSNNQCSFNGESGVKTYQDTLLGVDARCYRGLISDNTCHANYYDGVDACSSLTIAGTFNTMRKVTGNFCSFNGGTGMNIDGQFNQVNDNLFMQNYRHGIWGSSISGLALSQVKGNFCIDNNQSRQTSQADIGIVSAVAMNHIEGNYVWAGAGQNNVGIYAPGTNFVGENFGSGGSTFFFGNPGAISSVVQNNADFASGLQTDQAFILTIANNGGVMQHFFASDSGGLANSNLSSRIVGALNAYTNSPTGPDATTAMAAGGKIGGGAPWVFWCNTAAQASLFAQLLPSLVSNSSGTALCVQAQFSAVSINGVTLNRLAFVFSNATTGANFSLTPANIPAGKSIQIQFLGKLA